MNGKSELKIWTAGLSCVAILGLTIYQVFQPSLRISGALEMALANKAHENSRSCKKHKWINDSNYLVFGNVCIVNAPNSYCVCVRK